MIIKPGTDRSLPEEIHRCTFCGGRIVRGAVWRGPDVSICEGCLYSGDGPEILGRLLGDGLFATHGREAYAREVREVLARVEGGMWRTLYASARKAG